MSKKKFKPMLARRTKDYPIEEIFIKHPQGVLASIKRDGVRSENYENSTVSRALEDTLSLQVKEIASKTGLNSFPFAVEAEVYIHGWRLDEIKRIVVTGDIKSRGHLNRLKADARLGKLTRPIIDYCSVPKDLKFYIFEADIEGLSAIDRYTFIKAIPEALKKEGYEDVDERIVVVEQKLITNMEDLQAMYQEALDNGFEGLVLKTPDSKYHYNRASFNKGQLLKLVPTGKYRGKILDFYERFENTTEAHTNNLGYSTKRKLSENMVGTGIAATALVLLEPDGEEMRVTLSGTEEYRREIWENKEKYIGKTLIFEGLAYGAKRVPRNCSSKKIV